MCGWWLSFLFQAPDKISWKQGLSNISLSIFRAFFPSWAEREVMVGFDIPSFRPRNLYLIRSRAVFHLFLSGLEWKCVRGLSTTRVVFHVESLVVFSTHCWHWYLGTNQTKPNENQPNNLFDASRSVVLGVMSKHNTYLITHMYITHIHKSSIGQNRIAPQESHPAVSPRSNDLQVPFAN